MRRVSLLLALLALLNGTSSAAELKYQFASAKEALSAMQAKETPRPQRDAAAAWLKGHPKEAMDILPQIIDLYRVPRRQTYAYFYHVRDVLTSLAPESVPAMIDALADDEALPHMTHALWAYWRYRGRENALTHIAKGLTHEDPVIRARVALVLKRIAEDAVPAAPALAARLKDEAGIVRIAAAEALGAMGPAAAEMAPVLVENLSDKDEGAAFAASQALGRMGEAVLPPVIAALRSESPRARRFAANALAHIGDTIRDAGRDAATQAKNEQIALAKKSLLQAVDDADAYVRRNAIDALSRYGDPSVTQAIIRELGDPRLVVAAEACQSLQELAPEDPVVKSALRAYRDRIGKLTRPLDRPQASSGESAPLASRHASPQALPRKTKAQLLLRTNRRGDRNRTRPPLAQTPGHAVPRQR